MLKNSVCQACRSLKYILCKKSLGSVSKWACHRIRLDLKDLRKICKYVQLLSRAVFQLNLRKVQYSNLAYLEVFQQLCSQWVLPGIFRAYSSHTPYTRQSCARVISTFNKLVAKKAHGLLGKSSTGCTLLISCTDSGVVSIDPRTYSHAALLGGTDARCISMTRTSHQWWALSSANAGESALSISEHYSKYFYLAYRDCSTSMELFWLFRYCCATRLLACENRATLFSLHHFFWTWIPCICFQKRPFDFLFRWTSSRFTRRHTFGKEVLSLRKAHWQHSKVKHNWSKQLQYWRKVYLTYMIYRIIRVTVNGQVFGLG